MSEVTLDFIALLRRLVADVPSRGATLNAALQQLASQELRDLEPDASLLEALLSVPTTVRDSFSADDLYKWHTLLTGVLQIPEVVSAAPAAAAYATDALIDGAFARAALPPAEETAQAMTPGSSLPGCVSMAAQAAELGAVRALLHWLYRSGDVVVRLRLRSALGTSALRLCSSSLPPPGLRVLLEVLASIIRGFGASRPAHRSLLLNVLVPLHRPAARMDETTPVLSLYHESLVHCMLCLLRARPEWLLAALPPLLGAWPEPREGLSSKEVLLLHELERLLELASPAQRPAVSLAAAPVLARCISSDNSRVAERALTIFASDGARATLTSDFDGCVPLLLGALVRGGVPHWNATVNKMTHEALRLLSEADAGGFAAAAKQIFSTLGDASLGGTAVRMVFEYMHRIAPSPESLAAHAAPPAYVKEHLTAAPQLLPSIIFQELVFGRDLGSGSFSTVRYCKHVQRGTPAVSWPEYAAKVLCRQLLSQLGYEHAVRREIVVLRHLQHPGIARLVASFRWKEDIYLLLEYAAFGDLHGHLRRMGSLALPNARWLFAEVAAALAAVHAAGFAYGDLKPENILLTASGHAKLTDFGAARPLVGHEGALGVLAAAGNVIQELRDGDWSARRSAERRAAGATDDSPMGDAAAAGGAAAAAAAAGVAERGADCDAAAVGDDGRLEGTAAYLSPEIVTGGQPSEASDLWAFGCTLYQALCGRPPLWADTQEETMKRIVKFERVAEAQYPEQVPADARALIGSLLTPDPALRLRSIAGSATREGADGSSAAGAGVEGLAAVRGHPFFEGLDGDTLYVQTPPPLTRGAAAPQPHAAWSRRQNSIMWSPLPQRYAFGEDEGLALEPLVEGDEAGGSFTRPLTTNAEAAQAAEALRVPAPSESVCPPKTLAPMQETAEEHESEAMEA
ncbi:camp-dependent protein kinase catalytic subunit isoform [Chrysochromulina tobinii]|uniref:non-specific serine/threonine protein kinase n=1 Tax=Chrysochromulina tobinii TaxID=1460289 RepID=A0A0M0K5B4_9EUKA|nr:camp-dependent protein kinase catalytic subunit isoform [Chrysochromulina tobinii]|eukprot:KOO33573.1 camp-dependent protein kinase catalytic subunit isoform [Chrysochromulina sp. CCMP291]